MRPIVSTFQKASTRSDQAHSPLVGFWYGRFRVQRDAPTGVDVIRTHDGRPLASLDEVGNRSRAATVAPLRTLSLNDFLTAVDAKVRALGRP